MIIHKGIPITSSADFSAETLQDWWSGMIYLKWWREEPVLCIKWCIKWWREEPSCFHHVQFFMTPWTVAHQAPLSEGFSRQEYWSGLLENLWPRIFFPAKLSFRFDGRIKSCTDKQNLNKRIQHHQISFARNTEETSLGRKETSNLKQPSYTHRLLSKSRAIWI